LFIYVKLAIYSAVHLLVLLIDLSIYYFLYNHVTL